MKEILELFVDNNVANTIYAAQRMASKCKNAEVLDIINEMSKLQRKLSSAVKKIDWWGVYSPLFFLNIVNKFGRFRKSSYICSVKEEPLGT